MEPAALPAASTSSRPEGGAGKCGGKQPSGCAAATAARNSPSRKTRGDSVKGQASRAAACSSNVSHGPRRSWFVSCGKIAERKAQPASIVRSYRLQGALESAPVRHYSIAASPAPPLPKGKDNSYDARRQDPNRTRRRGVPAPRRAFARTHRRAEYRFDESCGLLPQLLVELDEGRRRPTRGSDVQGRVPRADLRHALRAMEGEASERGFPGPAGRVREGRPQALNLSPVYSGDDPSLVLTLALALQKALRASVTRGGFHEHCRR